MKLEDRTESEAIALLKDGICPICLLLVDPIGMAGGPAGIQYDYECESCGHAFTIFIDDKFGTETLEFEVMDED